ncbi:MAG: DVU0150 family protein [Thermodesulfobacteriota bacterium]
MRKLLSLSTLAALATALLPGWALAAGGKASDLVVVADTRVLSSGWAKYFANLYNENILLFAIWAVVLTAVMGSLLGVVMDFVMKCTGLDLTKRKILEH